MSVIDRPEEGELTAALLADLDLRSAAACGDCGRAICGHEYVMDVALGYKAAPLCVDCLARAHGLERDRFVARLLDFIRRKDCYRAGWEWSSRKEGAADPWRPACLASLRVEVEGSGEAEAEAIGAQAHEADWDAGAMACGDLVLELRERIAPLGPGEVLRLRALDAGARTDIPAWCRMTGHLLRRAAPPHYWIERKPDP